MEHSQAAVEVLSEQPTVAAALKNLLSLLLARHPRYPVPLDASSRELQLSVRAISLAFNAFVAQGDYAEAVVSST